MGSIRVSSASSVCKCAFNTELDFAIYIIWQSWKNQPQATAISPARPTQIKRTCASISLTLLRRINIARRCCTRARKSADTISWTASALFQTRKEASKRPLASTARRAARAHRQDAEYHWSVDCVKKPTVSVPLECTPRAWTVRSRSMDTLGSRIFVTARLDGVKHGPLTQFQRISFSCG